MRELWATGSGVRLELLEWRPTVEERGWGTPVIAVHGGIGRAETWRDEGEAAAAGRLGDRPRTLGAFSRRGMGRSEAPHSGYALSDFVDDLAAAVKTLGYPRFAIAAHSLGVPIAISYTSRSPDGVVGLALGDYGPRYPAFDETWMRSVEERHRAGTGAMFDLEGARRMRADSRAIDLSSELASIRCPVLVVTGDRDVALTPQNRACYEGALADVRVLILAGAGHMLSVESRPDAFHAALGSFIKGLDLPG